MATNFPTSLDSLTNPTASDSELTVSHSSQHANVNDAVEALEAKVGVNSSAVTTSHDYKLSEVTSTDKAVGKTATQTLTNKTLTAPTISGATLTTSTVNGVTLSTGSGTSNFLRGDGTYATPSTTVDASYSVKGIVQGLTDAATSGITISAGVISVNSGTGANQIVKLDGTGKLPALDGTNLTVADNFTAQSVVMTGSGGAASIPYFTTASTGASSTEPVFCAFSSASGLLSVHRFIKTTGGSMVLTHRVTLTASSTASTGSCAVVGSYVYILTNNGGSPVLVRCDKADLANQTTMTVSGTAFTLNSALFSNGTNLYNVHTANTARIYTISGTTATSSTTVTYTGATTTGAYWSDGTSVWFYNNNASGQKWAIAGGSTTATYGGFSSQYLPNGGSVQSQFGGIFKEANNSSSIITVLANAPASSLLLGYLIPVPIF